jgi:hypothetical protein
LTSLAIRGKLFAAPNLNISESNLHPGEPYWFPKAFLEGDLLGSCAEKSIEYTVLQQTPALVLPRGSEVGSIRTSNTPLHCDYLVLKKVGHFNGPVDIGTVVVLLGGNLRFTGGGKVGSILGSGEWAVNGEPLTIGSIDSTVGLRHPHGEFTIDPSLIPPAVETATLDLDFLDELKEITNKLYRPKLKEDELLQLYEQAKQMSFKISTSWRVTDSGLRGEFKRAVGKLLSDIVNKNAGLFEKRSSPELKGRPLTNPGPLPSSSPVGQQQRGSQGYKT